MSAPTSSTPEPSSSSSEPASSGSSSPQAAREALEHQLASDHAAGRYSEVAGGIVRGFGHEILRFLIGTLRDEDAGHEVFAAFCELVVRGLPAFEGRSSFRTWSYTLARNAAYRHRHGRQRRAAREVELSDDSPLSALVAKVRTETALHLKTEVKSRVAVLRDSLPEEERSLLILRIERGMAWIDIARILRDPAAAEPSDAEIKRDAAKLRKRYQVVKDRLRELGRAQGLAPEEE